jgi:hypothetical protein
MGYRRGSLGSDPDAGAHSSSPGIGFTAKIDVEQIELPSWNIIKNNS